MREIEPGEIVVIERRRASSRSGRSSRAPRHVCVFEHIYFARPDSLRLRPERLRGAQGARPPARARGARADADIVDPGARLRRARRDRLRRGGGMPFEMGLIRNHYVGRTFIEPQQLDPPLRRQGEAERACARCSTASASSSSTTRSCAARRSRKIVHMIRAGAARARCTCASARRRRRTPASTASTRRRARS